MHNLPEKYFPVIRRLREKRESLIYSPSANLIYFLEEQAPEDFIFSLYHEISHSCHMQSNIGLFLDSLAGMKSALARNIVLSMPERNANVLFGTFFSSEARTHAERKEVFAEHYAFFDTKEDQSYLRQCSKLFKDHNFNKLIYAYKEIEDRENILLDEWRFPLEGFAYYTEMCGLGNIERTYVHAKCWAEKLGASMTIDSFKSKINEMNELLSPTIENADKTAPSPEMLAASSPDAFDVYTDGASFLLKYFGNGGQELEISEAMQVASHIPVFRLPGLDAPLSEFKEAVTKYCSPRIRLARLTTCKKEGELTFESFLRYLSHANNDYSQSVNKYEDFTDWEYTEYWNSKLLCGLRGNNKIIQPSKHSDKDAHRYPYQTRDMKVSAIIGNSALSCQIQDDIGALPESLSDFDKQLMETQLERLYFLQAYEGFKVIFNA